MSLYVVWIAIYAQATVMAAILDWCKFNFPQGFLSGNQAKFALHIHVTAKPSKNNTLLTTTWFTTWLMGVATGLIRKTLNKIFFNSEGGGG